MTYAEFSEKLATNFNSPDERLCREYNLYATNISAFSRSSSELEEHNYCMEHVQEADYVGVIGPPEGYVTKIKADFTEDTFNQYVKILKSISPLVGESLDKYIFAYSNPFIYIGTGHARINYMMMMFWRYLWMNPKFVYLCTYLDDLGFKWYEILLLSGVYQNIWKDNLVSPMVPQSLLAVDENLLQQIKNVVTDAFIEKDFSFTDCLTTENHKKYLKALLGAYTDYAVVKLKEEYGPFVTLHTLLAHKQPFLKSDLENKERLQDILAFFKEEDT
jgi:hypothetical protein